MNQAQDWSPDEKVADLADLLKKMRKGWLVGLIVGAVALGVGLFLRSPRDTIYRYDTVFQVTLGDNIQGDRKEILEQAALLVKTDAILRPLSDQLGVGYGPTNLRPQIFAEVDPAASTIKVLFFSSSQHEGSRVSREIMQIFPLQAPALLPKPWQGVKLESLQDPTIGLTVQPVGRSLDLLMISFTGVVFMLAAAYTAGSIRSKQNTRIGGLKWVK